MSILEKIKSIFSPQKIRHERIDPNSLSSNQLTMDLAKEVAELKGVLARKENDEAQQRQSDEDFAEEDEVKITLNKRKDEILAEETFNFFSLRKLFLADPIRLDKLKFLTWDRKKILSKFQDIGFAEDGDLVVLGENNQIILKARTLPDIFQSVPAVENDVNAGFMVVNKDESGNYIPNIQVAELPEIIPTTDGKFYYSQARKKPLYEFLNEYREQISELQGDVEELEMNNKSLLNDNNELKRANRVMQSSVNVAQRTLSENEQVMTSMNDVFSKLNKEMTQQRLNNMTIEEWNENMQKILEVLRAKAERNQSETSDEKAREKLDNAVSLVQNMTLPSALAQIKANGAQQPPVATQGSQNQGNEGGEE